MNTVTVYQGGKYNSIKIYSSDEWFKECTYFTFNVNKEKLIIRKQRLDTSRGAKKKSSQKHNPNAAYFEFVSDIPHGIYKIDKRLSNEDELIVHL
jgi:hypothetical protein